MEARSTTCFPWTIRRSPGRSRRGQAPTAGKTVFTYSGEMSGIPTGNAPNILAKSFTITADIEVPQAAREGMLVTLGGRFGGYGLYLNNGKPVFTYNFLDLERFRWEGRCARAGQTHPRVRLHL